MLLERVFPFNVVAKNMKFLKFSAPRFAQTYPYLIEGHKYRSIYTKMALDEKLTLVEASTSGLAQTFMAAEEDLQALYDSELIKQQ